MSRTGLAGVVLAAGRGRRLRPLTDIRPKPLCPIANRPLLDYALDRLSAVVGAEPTSLAVNAHWLADQVADQVADRAQLSIEQPVALGTAGALGALHDWLDGRDVLLTNADAYLTGGLHALTDGWDGERIRLLSKETHHPSDFGTLRYVGACLLPWSVVAPLAPVPSGLYELVWQAAVSRGDLDLVRTDQVAIDCGRPSDYLAANLHASGGASVVGPGAVVEGRVERCVVWPGAYVGPAEHLVDTIRAGTRDQPITVPAAATTER